jgi:non-lysosomal glucosylceramidase
MEGEQHNTYDIEFYGPNTMVGTLYLGALKAAAIMARHLGEDDRAAEYERVFAHGRDRLDAELWNGEFYIQTVVRPTAPPATRRPSWHRSALVPGEDMPRYQYGPGCLSDQLLGQWFAHVVGVGYLLPEEHVRQAVAAVFRHNWRANLFAHHSCQRTFALNDESCLLCCSWPNGGRPRYPFPYADECFTGIEYQVAAHLIYEGFVDEGLTIVAGVRSRHDGVRRNPWDEFECGHHYARAMSSWSLLLALSGYHYSAPARHLSFAPRVDAEDFRCFFSTGSAWGSYAHRRSAGEQESHLGVFGGQVVLRRFDVQLPVDVARLTATVTGRAGVLADRAQVTDGRLVVEFDQDVSVGAGETLAIMAHW